MKVSVLWQQTVAVSRTEPTIQVIPNAMSRRGKPLHDVTITALRELDAKYPRFLTFGPTPRMQIAALRAPDAEGTSWDFSLIDPEVIAFLEATKGREPILNFGVVPPWMLKRPQPPTYATSIDELDWGWLGIVNGAFEPSLLQLADPSGQQIGEYFARIVSWYTQGGFVDENGKRHESGHHYELPWWGVLNEFDHLGAQQYTVVYDAIVSAVLKVSPHMRFVGLELLGKPDLEFVEYFLDPKNHAPGVSVDMIAYHFYARGVDIQSNPLDVWQYTFFDQADGFLDQARVVEVVRKRVSPATLTYPSEIGSMTPCDARCLGEGAANKVDLPDSYWNLSAAPSPYIYIGLAKLGVDAAGEAGFSFYPGNFAGVSMVDWETGELNARFHVLKLIRDHLGPGDRLAMTTCSKSPFRADVAVQAFDTSKGRRLLVINKRNRAVDLELGDAASMLFVVDQNGAGATARREAIEGGQFRLAPFAVGVVVLDE